MRKFGADRFNDSHQQSQQRVLVATDAIGETSSSTCMVAICKPIDIPFWITAHMLRTAGMGLNLNIKRVIFTTLEKYAH